MESPTLLCIDDRPQMLELRKAPLESQGYCVKLASSGHTAIKMLEETSVAAVLLEYNPEGIDAEAVACHIKQRFPSRRSPRGKSTAFTLYDASRQGACRCPSSPTSEP
jgi:response regulator RpfG family c-di-GMP phosphodiesterase